MILLDLDYCDSKALLCHLQENSCLPTDNFISGLSPKGRSNGDKDGYLLPEFNELLKEFDLPATKASSSPKKDVEPLKSDSELPTGYKVVKRDDHEQEIKSLRNLVKILKERERALEIQLLEYYGLKEQETAVMELHNRLKINNMEAKLFTLKIESLHADNRRLEAQVTDYAKVVADLEAARAKIKLLKRKLRSGAEQNKEQILALQQRVTKLQEQDQEQEQIAVGSNANNQPKLQKLKELEEEVEELRKCKYNLQLENSDLGRRLDYAQILATSVLEDEETEALKEERERLKKQNEDLTKEIERLQDDRCADVEELVYLRWINACLRYELRNYQPGPGKTVARDLSKTLSPKSEEKAKQLILEYANKEGLGGRGINSREFDSDHSSSSRASYITESGDLDDSPVDNSSVNKSNTSSRRKIFGRLMKLLRGNGEQHSRGSAVEVPASVEDVVGVDSTDYPESNSGVPTGTDGQSNKSRTSSLSPFRNTLESPSSRHSLDSSSRRSLESSSRHSLESSRLSWDLHKSLYLQELKTEKIDNTNDLEGGQKNSDDVVVGSSPVYRKSIRSSENEDDDLENDKKSDLLKYARALMDAHDGTDTHDETPKFCRRTASYSSL